PGPRGTKNKGWSSSACTHPNSRLRKTSTTCERPQRRETSRIPSPSTTTAPSGVGADWANLKSPETYVGRHKAEHFASPGGVAVNRTRAYAVPPRLRLNQWALSGDWTVKTEAGAEHRRRTDRPPVSCARSPPHHGATRPPRRCFFSG